jgi:hypothetical protein
MKTKTVIILAALIAATFAYVAVRNLTTSTDTSEPETKDVFDSTLDRAEEIVIRDADGDRTVLRRSGGTWRIVEPFQADAVGGKVFEIQALVRNVTYEQVLPSTGADALGDDLTGLDNPRWTISVADANGTSQTLHVGRPTPKLGGGGDRFYVRPEGDARTFVVAKDYATVLSRPVRELRDKAVWKLPRGQIARIVVEGEERFTLARSDDRWSLVEPVSARADKESVETLLDAVDRLEAERFVGEVDTPAQAALYGLDRPRLSVEVVVQVDPNTSRTHRVLFGSKADESVFAALSEASGEVFQLPAGLLETLQPDLQAIREKQLLDFQPGDIDRLELPLPSAKAQLTRKDFTWRIETPLTGQANRETVTGVLDALAGLQAVEYRDDVPSLAGVGLETPDVITLYPAGQDRTVQLLVGDTVEGRTYVKVAGGRSVALVDKAVMDRILPPVATFWHTDVLSLPWGSRVTSLSIRRDDATLAAQRDPNGWRISEPVETDANGDAVAKLIQTLVNLQGTKTVAIGEVPDRYARADDLATYTIQAEVPVERDPNAPGDANAPADPNAPGTETKAFELLVARVDGEAYAWYPDANIQAVRELSDEVAKNLDAQIRPREVLDLDLETIQRVDVTPANGKAFSLKRSGDQWQLDNASGELEGWKVDNYVRDAGSITVKRFALHRDSLSAEFGLAEPAVTIALHVEGRAKPIVVKVSAAGPAGSEERYASVSSVPGVLVLESWLAKDLTKPLDDLLVTDE